MRHSVAGIILCAAAMAATACSESAGNDADKCPASDTSDTAVLEEVSLPDRADDYMSSDLRMEELRGSVRKAVVRTSACDADGDVSDGAWWDSTVLVYDRKGVIDTKNAELQWKQTRPTLTRNRDGAIVRADWPVSGTAGFISDTFRYGDDGMLSARRSSDTDGQTVTTYTYDNGHELVREVAETCGSDMSATCVTSYKVLERDSHGNWTRRMATGCETASADDAGTDSMVWTTMHVRTIEYF